MKIDKLRKLIRETIKEANFDKRLAQQMDMSDDEFEKNIASRDVGDSFPQDTIDDLDDIDMTGYKRARGLIEKLRKDYKNMSDQDLDDFSVKMVEHFLDNLSAQVRAKTILTTRGI